MAKKTLTQYTAVTNTIQSLADQVKGQATQLKVDFDTAAINQKTYNNTVHLVELADETPNNSGSNAIGHNSASIAADNVGDALEENRLAINDVTLGQIPDGSITKIKLTTPLQDEITASTDGVADNASDISDLQTDLGNAEDDITELQDRGSIISVTSSVILALTDAYNYLRVTTASTISITVPPNSSVAFPIGAEISVIQATAGSATIAAGIGVTINSKDSALEIDGQFGAVALKKIDTDVWDLVGALA